MSSSNVIVDSKGESVNIIDQGFMRSKLFVRQNCSFQSNSSSFSTVCEPVQRLSQPAALGGEYDKAIL